MVGLKTLKPLLPVNGTQEVKLSLDFDPGLFQVLDSRPPCVHQGVPGLVKEVPHFEGLKATSLAVGGHVVGEVSPHSITW